MKNDKELLEETEKLKNENAALRQELMQAKETIEQIKTGHIDALVDNNRKDLKVYAEKTADNPYQILIEKMNEGAVTLDETGTILYSNSSFADMVDLPLQKVIGSKFEKFIAISSKEHYDILFKKGWKEYVKDEVHLIANQKMVMPILISANTFELDHHLFLSVILTDVTIRNKNQAELRLNSIQLEQKNAELEKLNAELSFENLEKKKRAVELNTANTDVKSLEELVIHKDSILAILSHDLRSPLAGIIGITEYLKSNFKKMGVAEIGEMLDLLDISSKQELNMLDYLVEWARIKYASEVFSPTKIELSQYVTKVFDLLKETAALNTINLHHEIEENTCVFADSKMVLSILQNIVSNAIKHSRPEGKISVTAKRKDDKIIVEIKDTGIGMSKEIQNKLFSPQMDTLSKERMDNKGSGIGLLLVKGFLEKNGGEIWVESVEGVGSSFYFTLPVDKALEK